MKHIPGPSNLRQRRLLGGTIAGGGIALFGYQLWRLIGFLMGQGESVGTASPPPHLGFGGLGTTLLLGLLGLLVGLAIGWSMGRRASAPRPEGRPDGITITGEARRVRDHG